jgi:16S rRNA (guanine527-N7)-methyltransferase
MVQAEQASTVVFGERLSIAEQYAEILSSVGVERGLLGPREVPRIWDRHLLNCVVLQELVERGARVVDVGSGAGLPGIPLAIARPDLLVTLVEPLLRRASFLQQVVDTLGLDVAVYRGRAEDLATQSTVGSADVIAARAVAPLGKLMGWCLPLARAGGRVLAIKGDSAAEELARDRLAIRRLGGQYLQVRQCGADLLATPTTVVEAVRG